LIFQSPEIARLGAHQTRLAEAKKLLQAAQKPLRLVASAIFVTVYL
jgi:hypothetical protein